jgi:peptide/nickel transport system permease protein
MLSLTRRRLASSVLTLFGIAVITFFLARLTGSPAFLFLPEGSTPEMFAVFNHQHGYDKPLPMQFLEFCADLLRLDFGSSLTQQRPAATVAIEAIPPTLALGGICITLMLVLSLLLGTLAAVRPFSRTDKAITFASLALSSVPDFWLALVGVIVFAVRLGWVPTSGQSDLSSWMLPIATLTLPTSGSMIQVVRGAMIEALGAGYVRNARARGFSQTRLAFRHALRNAALPIITVAGDRAVHMFSGTIIVSAIFAWPGIGFVLVQAVMMRDFPLLQASIFIVGLMVIVINILIDILYGLADPRLRLS